MVRTTPLLRIHLLRRQTKHIRRRLWSRSRQLPLLVRYNGAVVPSLIKHTLTSLSLAAAASTTTATAPVALDGPPPSEPPDAARDVTRTVHTEQTVPESQVYDRAKLAGAHTVEPHSTNQAAPVLSATSGPLDNNPAVEYTETVNSSNTAHTPYSEHEAVEDPPFATPMEAPESATFGQVAYAAAAEKGTKTT